MVLERSAPALLQDRRARPYDGRGRQLQLYAAPRDRPVGRLALVIRSRLYAGARGQSRCPSSGQRHHGHGKCVYDTVPDTSSPPPNDAVVAGGVRTKSLAQIRPGCSGSQDPENSIEATAVVNPGNTTRLVRQHGFNGGRAAPSSGNSSHEFASAFGGTADIAGSAADATQ
jgi:hypothetical protein